MVCTYECIESSDHYTQHTTQHQLKKEENNLWTTNYLKAFVVDEGGRVIFSYFSLYARASQRI